MQELTFEHGPDGAQMTPAPQQDSLGVWVPLTAFCAAVGASLKDIDGAGQLAVCGDGDLCIPLAAEDVRSSMGTAFGRLEAFAAPLGLAWQTRDGALILDAGDTAAGDTAIPVGLRFGDQPPRFELPDVHGGQLVSSDVYYNKPAVFYMWASW